MRRALHHLFVIVLLCSARFAFAQVQVDAPIITRPSQFLSDWQSRASTATVMVRNAGPTRLVKIRTDFTLNGQHVANSDPAKLPPITLNGPSTSNPTGLTIFNGEDLVPMNAMHYENAIDANSQRSGRVPEGLLCLKVTVLDAATGAPIASSPDQAGCTQIFAYSPPQLMLPEDGSVLCRAGANNVIFTRDGSPMPFFQWTPISPSPTQTVRYHFAIFEVYPGQEPIAAIRGNRALVESDLLMQTSILWPAQYFFPEVGKRYIWSVRALDEAGNAFVLSNDGWAQPYLFTVSWNCDTLHGGSSDSSTGVGAATGADSNGTTGRTNTGLVGGGSGGTGGAGGDQGMIGFVSSTQGTSPLYLSLANSSLLFYPRAGAVIPGDGANVLRDWLSGNGATEASATEGGGNFAPRILPAVAHGSDGEELNLTFSTPQVPSDNATNDIILLPPDQPIHGGALEGFVVNAHSSPFDRTVFHQLNAPPSPLLRDSRFASAENDLWHSIATTSSRELSIDPSQFGGTTNANAGVPLVHISLDTRLLNDSALLEIERALCGTTDHLIVSGVGAQGGSLDLTIPLERYSGQLQFTRSSSANAPITGHMALTEPITVGGTSATLILIGDVLLNDEAASQNFQGADLLAGGTGGSQGVAPGSSALRSKIRSGMLDFTVASPGFNNDAAPASLVRKHLGPVKYEDISARLSVQGSPIYEWIQASFSKSHQRKDGAIVAADFNTKARSTREFTNALITEVGFPALDAGSKDPAYLSVLFSPEIVRSSQAGTEVAHPGDHSSAAKKWSPANFKLDISGLDEASKRVNKIESFTLKQKITQVTGGNTVIVPEIPHLIISVPPSDRESFTAWLTSGLSKDGTLEIHGGEGDLLVQLKLHDLRITALARRAPGVYKLTPGSVDILSVQ
ncbi:MAG: hypothetical protein JSS75_06540 [Bacteroidetes bacterium]|nr:hypothetical protein [Bacteroidota bacterium]